VRLFADQAALAGVRWLRKAGGSDRGSRRGQPLSLGHGRCPWAAVPGGPRKRQRYLSISPPHPWPHPAEVRRSRRIPVESTLPKPYP